MWALPALLSGVLTAGVVLVLGLIVHGQDQGELGRHRITGRASNPGQGMTATNRPDITLEADGLGLVDFGQPADTVVATLTDRLGTPDESTEQPCERDPAVRSRWVRWADLSLRFGAGGFAAYIEGVHFPPGPKALGFATARGLSPGDSVKRLHQVYGETVPIRTQSAGPGRPETAIFTISKGKRDGSISGVIEQPGKGGSVVSIFAGDICS